MTPSANKKSLGILLALLLTSCGSGGGGDDGSPSQATPTNLRPVNLKPVITNFEIIDDNGGQIQVNDLLTASYTWTDPDNDLEGASTFIWFRNDEVIEGATASTYRVKANDRSQKIRVDYLPVAATGFAFGIPQSNTVFVSASPARVSTFANTGFGRGNGMVATAKGGLLVSGGINAEKIILADKNRNVSDFDITNFDSPSAMSFDTDGNLFVINASTNSIHKIAEDGSVTEFASDLDGPTALAINNNNEVFVTLFGADSSGLGATVLKFQPDGSQETFATGNGMADLVGITIDDSGGIYVINQSDGQIFEISDGSVSIFADIDDSGFNHIVYANDFIYAPSSASGIVYRINRAGDIESYAGNSENALVDGDIVEANFSNPTSIALSNNGRSLFVLDGNGDIRKIDTSIQVASQSNSGMTASNGITVSAQGDIFISGTANGSSEDGKIVRVTQNGQVSNFVSAGLTNPMAMDFDSNGNLYVSDYANGTIQKVTADGTMSEFASNLDGPMGLTIKNDEIFVTLHDGNEVATGNTVVKFQSDASMETLASNEGMNGVSGICVDDESNIYVANLNGGAIFKISDGLASAFAQIPEATINQLVYLNGYIYAPSTVPSVIYRVSKSGEVETFAGTANNALSDGDINNAEFSAPKAIAVSESSESLFLLDSEGEVREVYGVTPLEITEGIDGVFWEETSENIELSLNVRGEGQLNYRWYQEGESEVISTEPILSLPYSRDASGTFWAVVSDDISEVTSDKEELTVKYMPEIIVQPQAATFNAGETGTLSVEAEGINLSYEWMHEDHRQGGNSPTVEFTFGGNYFVTITSRLANGDVFTIKSSTVLIRFR